MASPLGSWMGSLARAATLVKEAAKIRSTVRRGMDLKISIRPLHFKSVNPMLAYADAARLLHVFLVLHRVRLRYALMEWSAIEAINRAR